MLKNLFRNANIKRIQLFLLTYFNFYKDLQLKLDSNIFNKLLKSSNVQYTKFYSQRLNYRSLIQRHFNPLISSFDLLLSTIFLRRIPIFLPFQYCLPSIQHFPFSPRYNISHFPLHTTFPIFLSIQHFPFSSPCNISHFPLHTTFPIFLSIQHFPFSSPYNILPSIKHSISRLVPSFPFWHELN